MSAFLSRLIGILLLRDGPQNLPAGYLPMLLAIGFYAAVSAVSMNLSETAEHPLRVVVLAVLLPLILVRIVLTLKGKPARWAQTLTALFGTGALLSLLSLPLGLITGSEPSAPVVVASLVLFFWSFAVDGHIWRHALDTNFTTGLAVAVILFGISMFVISSLAGPL